MIKKMNTRLLFKVTLLILTLTLLLSSCISQTSGDPSGEPNDTQTVEPSDEPSNTQTTETTEPTDEPDNTQNPGPAEDKVFYNGYYGISYVVNGEWLSEIDEVNFTEEPDMSSDYSAFNYTVDENYEGLKFYNLIYVSNNSGNENDSAFFQAFIVDGLSQSSVDEYTADFFWLDTELNEEESGDTWQLTENKDVTVNGKVFRKLQYRNTLIDYGVTVYDEIYIYHTEGIFIELRISYLEESEIGTKDAQDMLNAFKID